MLIVAMMGGVLAFRFWLFPPDAVSDRVRSIVIGCGVAMFAGGLWLNSVVMQSAVDARAEARRQFLRSEQRKDEFFRRVNAEARESGPGGYW